VITTVTAFPIRDTVTRRIFQLIQPTLNILIANRNLPQHSLQLSLPCICTLAESRDLSIPLSQIARELSHHLHGPCTCNQTLNMRIIGQMQGAWDILGQDGIGE
jgi:hypothetical protein